MKFRKDFVTNSSSSSYVCEICGRTESGFDIGLSEVEIMECVNGHTFCCDEALKSPNKEELIKMILVFNALGIPRENIDYKTEFVNKSKESYLVVQGNVELKDLNYENGINIRMKIDTDIYDGYDVYIENGLVLVRLHEIVNEAPILKDYGMNK